jgi:hypothetical protein
MNEIEFERSARHAAANIRNEADRIAVSSDALATLLTNEAPVADESPPTTVPVDPIRPPRRRTPWLPILIAACTIAAVAGVVVLTSRDGDESIVVTTEPAQPDSTQPDATVPTVFEPDAEQPDSTGADEPFSPFSFDVPDDIGQPLPRTELLTATIGSGELELGWDDCQECEQLRPWGPVVDTDDTIYIADVVNSRWRVVRDGTSTSIPFPDGEVVAGSPVIGPDGLLYAPVAAELRHSSPRRVVAYDLATFREVASYPIGPSTPDRLELVNGELLLGGIVVTTFDVPLGTPTIDIDHEARLVTVSLSGTQREFHFPDEWLIDGRDAAPIDDGSVVVRALAPLPADEFRFEVVLVRLWLDGTTAAGIVNNGSTTNSAIQITSDGMVQLEGTIVVHYDLPEFAGTDPLVGWSDAAQTDQHLALVPRPVQAGVSA